MKAKVPWTHGSHNATPESLSVGVRLPHNSSFDKWKYSFFSRKNPEVSNRIMVWQLLGLRGPGLLFFCSISLKFASWAKRAAGALAIMSAFHASGRKRAKPLTSWAAPFQECSKNFCTTPNLWSQGHSLATRKWGRKCQVWVGCISFPDQRGVYTK